MTFFCIPSMIGTTIIEPKRGSSPETIFRELLVEIFGERERVISYNKEIDRCGKISRVYVFIYNLPYSKLRPFLIILATLIPGPS